MHLRDYEIFRKSSNIWRSAKYINQLKAKKRSLFSRCNQYSVISIQNDNQ